MVRDRSCLPRATAAYGRTISVNGQLILSAMRDGEVAGTQAVPATHDGPDLESAFNPAYLASVVAGIDGEARIGFMGALKPARVRAADGFTAIVMPIRLPE